MKDAHGNEIPSVSTAEFFEAAARYCSAKAAYHRSLEEGALTDEEKRSDDLDREVWETDKILWNYLGGIDHACYEGIKPWDFLDYNVPMEEAKKHIEYKKTSDAIQKWENEKESFINPAIFLFCPTIVTMWDGFNAMNIPLSLLWVPSLSFFAYCIDLLFGKLYEKMLWKYWKALDADYKKALRSKEKASKWILALRCLICFAIGAFFSALGTL